MRGRYIITLYPIHDARSGGHQSRHNIGLTRPSVLSGIPVLGRRRAQAVKDDGDRLFGGFVVVGAHGLASDYQRLASNRTASSVSVGTSWAIGVRPQTTEGGRSKTKSGNATRSASGSSRQVAEGNM